jgi:hypothetical protein
MVISDKGNKFRELMSKNDENKDIKKKLEGTIDKAKVIILILSVKSEPPDF